MKKLLLILSLTICGLKGHTQIKFSSGYYINNSDERVECQIRNVDWRSNPTAIEYKISESGETQIIKIESIKEFGVTDSSKFIRAIVDIDRSTESINSVGFSEDRNPVFNEEELFLKVLIEGKANLYEYVDGNLTRFFYSVDDSDIEQLVYKTYFDSKKHTDRVDDLSGDFIGTNSTYKQQLWNNLKCPTISMKDVDRLYYSTKNLTKFFIEVNNCNNSEIKSFENNEKRDFFNLTFRPRYNSNSFTLENNQSNNNTNFDKNSSFGFGLEAEFVLPFNKNKWALFIEPTYQTLKSEKTENTSTVSGGTITYDMNYKALEVPAGVRHYFYLNDDSKIFINVGLSFYVPFKSTLDTFRSDGSQFEAFEIIGSNNLIYGLGYKFDNKYSVELRYQERSLLANYVFFNSDFKTLSIILGYSFF